MDNLELYNRFAQPPADALKPFNTGKFAGTDINPMWRIKALTEAFGPCGTGWYTDILRMWREDTEDGTSTVYCHVNLHYRTADGWSAPVVGIGGNTLMRKTSKGSTTTDEAYKMAYTDAVGIACKALGIGANIWWQESRTKYTANDQPPAQPQQPPLKPFTPPEAKPAEVTREEVFSPNTLIEDIKRRYNTDAEGVAQMRKTLIAGGVIPDKLGKDMSKEDWMQFVRAVDANFGT